ncbi:hypothetical protein Btru_035913 [Bulinus truncatus]|nr:hypothetical protein Btru_035913 [Bulinus truncatus]
MKRYSRVTFVIILKMNIAEVSGRTEDASLFLDFDRCYHWVSSLDRDKKYKYTITTDIVLPKALDGGYGWTVVFGSFSIAFICGGIFASFGVLYSELLTHYNESRSKTSFVGSVFFGFSMLLGPLTSVLTKRFGSRTMTIVGGLVSSLGMFLSMFATSINVLIVTFGLLVGAGFSCCFIAGVDIIASYFEKKISLATGIAISGSGFGTVTFAPLVEYLIGELNLAGMFLIMSGVCLNLIVCGMLFEPLKLTKKERRLVNLGNFVKHPNNRRDIEMPETTYRVSPGVTENDDTMSSVSVPTFVPECLRRNPSAALMKALQRASNRHVTLHRYVTNAVLQSNYVRELKPGGSPSDRASSTFVSAESNTLFDFSHFYSLFMVMFLLSNFMFYFWIDVPYIYAPDYAVGAGLERSDAVYIISLMGVAVTSGQIAFGMLGDTKVDVLHVFATSTALSGLLVCFIPMTYSIITMVMCFIPLGFCMSANSSLKFALLAEHVGLSKMTQAYGILMLSQGTANFFGPIVSGR